MTRENILEIVSAIEPFDGLETEHKSEILDWINSEATLYRITKPDIPPKHLVSYFVVTDFAAKSILLVDHRNACKWLPTGGHVERDEDPLATVEREAKEELNLIARFSAHVGKLPLFITSTQTTGFSAIHTDVSLWYVLVSDRTVPVNYDENEFLNAQWFSYDEILQTDINRLDPHMHRFIHKLIAKTRE